MATKAAFFPSLSKRQYEEINRFLTAEYDTKIKQYNALFGTDAWQNIVNRPELHELYRNQLINVAGAKYVRSFCMRNKRNAKDYYLFFATKHLRGMKAMKEAMWKVDPTGAYTFSDFTNPYQLFLLSEPDYRLLQAALSQHFGGSVVSLKEIEDFVIGETPFLYFKTEALKPMEEAKPPQLEVVKIDPLYKRRRGTYPNDKVNIRFL